MGQTQSLEPQDGGASSSVKDARAGDAETRTNMNVKISDGLSEVTDIKTQKQPAVVSVRARSPSPLKSSDEPSSLPTSSLADASNSKQRITAKSTGISASKKNPPNTKKNRWTFFRRKNRRSKATIITTGLTMNLDEEHNMLLFIPEKHQAMQQKQERRGGSVKVVIDLTIDENRKRGNSTTQLIVKDSFDVREAFSLKLKGRKDSPVDPSIICGMQIFLSRYDPTEEPANPPSESAPTSDCWAHRGLALPGGFQQIKAFGCLNVTKPGSVNDEKLDELLKICKGKLFDGKKRYDEEEVEGSGSQGKDQTFSSRVYDLSGNSRKLAKVFSAVVPRGVGREIFTNDSVINTTIPPVDEMICIDAENQIYVCDIGLTSAQCDFIVDTTERCSRGTYAAYTYAKQTLGCRDFDELATICEWPVMRAYSSICHHLEDKVEGEKRTKKTLVLDDREPHLVKYDTSKKERQKLDMHTDKSDWTFIIALSEGNGGDYTGGGTYMESIDATIHLQKGHALIFPGKRRHRGQKIINGCRFLLVGFLVERKESDENGESEDDNVGQVQNYMNSVF